MANDATQFKVPIPSLNFRPNSFVNNQHANAQNARNDYFCAKSSGPPSLWGGSNGRSDREMQRTQGFNPMPPPQSSRGYQASFKDNSIAKNSFFGPGMIHSTPVQRSAGIGQYSGALQESQEPFNFCSNWSRTGSISYRGNESVRSFNSISTGYVDLVITKALGKFLERSTANPDVHDMAIQVATGLRKYAHEAALELGPPESSMRSVYSEKGSNWRSNMSVVSETSQGTFHSLLKKERTVQPNRREAACSIQCSVEESRVDRRKRLSLVEEDKTLTKPAATGINIVEKSLLPRKRSLSVETSDSSDDDFGGIPQTVKRKIKQKEAIPGVQVLGSPAITNLMNDIAMERHEKMKEVLKRAEEKSSSETPRRKKPIKTKTNNTKKVSSTKIQITKKKAPGKNNSDSTENSRLITTTISTTTTVQCTRSGRNVKKPVIYQVPGKRKSVVRPKSKGKEETTSIDIEINVSDEDHAIKYTKRVKQTKPVETVLSKPKEPQLKSKTKISAVTSTSNENVSVSVENLVYTRSGRAIKPTQIFGGVLHLSNSLNDTKQTGRKASKAVVAVKENIPPKRIKERPNKKDQPPVNKNNAKSGLNEGRKKEEPTKSINLDISELSFGGTDFFIPEVTQSTRRAGVKNMTKKASGAALGCQTPPLLHFAAHLHPNLVGSSTPGQQTPDWQISQRSQSELKEFQKRKVQQKNKNITKMPVNGKKKAKPSKSELAAMKFMCGPRPAATPMLPAYACDSDSDLSDISPMES